MLRVTAPVTPEEIQKQEDWVNQTLRVNGVTVCLHADTTQSIADGMYRVECDYCPAFTVSPTSLPVRLVPWYFTDGPAVL